MPGNMRNIILALTILFSAVIAAASENSRATLEPEALRYNVMFKWGLINKKAGTATLSLRNGGNSYITTLTAASEPWADRFYKVRDTLNGCLQHADLKPVYYEKRAHEGGDHKHDRVDYDYSQAGLVIGHCSHKVYKKGELQKDETRDMEAEGSAIDMLTAFYYMRYLSFDTMSVGGQSTIAIFSGRQKETLTINYMGTADIEIDGKSYSTYHIRFIFTSKGGKKTSDDMDAWISTDAKRIPVKLEGKLPVGKVRCFLATE